MSSTSIFGFLFDGYMPSIVLATIAVLIICWQRLSLQLDPREPPILKPSIPFIGHIIGMMTKQTKYFDELYEKTPMPIATLPMLNGKVYMITTPSLIQSALRHKDLSFEPFEVEFAQRMLGVSDETMIPVRKPNFMNDFTKAIHGAMMTEHLYKMNAQALNNVAITINGLGKELEVDSIYLWLRETLTIATCNALLGSHNPMIKDPSLVDALWDFEGGLLPLLLNIYPSITAPKAYRGRAKLQTALREYYAAGYELLPDVAQIAKARVAHFRRHNIPTPDIGNFEIALLHVSTANAIPTLFWLYVQIVSSPDLVASIREEVESILITDPKRNEEGKRVISIDISKFETHCPLLSSSYREIIRLCNAQLGTRRAMADALITSPATPTSPSQTYLIKAGTDVQMPAGVSHMSSIWGPDAASFNARRFLKVDENAPDNAEKAKEDREQKKAYIPFGGGKHLCPGRNFAFAEIVGMVATMIVGFEAVGQRGDEIKVPKMGRPKFGEAVCKPPAGKEGVGMGAKFVRRAGWEDVEWKFIC